MNLSKLEPTVTLHVSEPGFNANVRRITNAAPTRSTAQGRFLLSQSGISRERASCVYVRLAW